MLKLYIIKPLQIQPNVIACVNVKGSPNIKTPWSKISVGEMYCSNPTRESGIRFAPALNKIRGIAVTIPENRIRKLSKLLPKYVFWSVVNIAIPRKAIGNMKNVSSVML